MLSLQLEKKWYAFLTLTLFGLKSIFCSAAPGSPSVWLPVCPSVCLTKLLICRPECFMQLVYIWYVHGPYHRLLKPTMQPWTSTSCMTLTLDLEIFNVQIFKILAIFQEWMVQLIWNERDMNLRDALCDLDPFAVPKTLTLEGPFFFK